MPETLTLYTAKVCPYAHRVELALAEAKAQFQTFEVDLQNKPVWYAPQVNPASKVPAIAYGGPEVPPEQPSPDSTKIAESLVLLEFVADIFPESNILPKDPVARAKVRFFIDAVGNKFNPAYFGYVVTGKGTQADLIKGFKDIQALLPETGFAVGEWSIADAAIAPFIARLFVALENDFGLYAVGEGPKTLELIKTSPELKRIQTYIDDITARKSFTDTFVPSIIKNSLIKRFANATRASSAL
ncbi:hypothetical protein EUX98_g8658 [Antrodiella citrinella]|uniref:GST N-terminal domain-containing protein n=1 Tax=Antrodiella citrinella TaxID=2447956 RepID=A0A4V3XG41_9APHY|nr:hypothetical protein EUX98_g8658 [Antrodiella citrinella]